MARAIEDYAGDEHCQRCRRTADDLHGLWMNGWGIDEFKLPLRMEWQDRTHLYLYGLLLCNDCLEDFWGAFGYWWVRAPRHVLDENPFPARSAALEDEIPELH